MPSPFTLGSVKEKYRYSLVLLRELVVTDFKLRYQGSILGYLWSLMKPIFLFIIMYIVFVYFLKIGAGIPHWPVQLLLGIVLWSFFAEVTNNSITAVVGRGDLIRKINFPKYVIIIAGVISALINLLINLAVLLVFALINGVDFGFHMLLIIFFIAELLVFSLGLGFFLSALFVKLRDINYIWEIVMQGLFYASIVVYPIIFVTERSERLAQLLLLNPVAQVIQDARHVFISSDAQTLFSISGGEWYIALIPVAISIIVFIAGAIYFRKQSPTFAENV